MAGGANTLLYIFYFSYISTQVSISLLIAGSRNIDICLERLTTYVDGKLKLEHSQIGQVITGGATGVDRSGHLWAVRMGIPSLVIRPDYTKYPAKLAPKYRNWQMVDIADVGLFIWDGFSGGTAQCIAAFASKNKPYAVIVYN